MQKNKQSLKLLSVVQHLAKWSILVLPVSLITGSLVALFLWMLGLVTAFRITQQWIVYLLPLAGILIYFLYKYFGGNSAGGNNLIMDEIHEPGGGVPARMAPMVVLTTLLTHLFGGSAGREGTAVQVGGSMAGLLSRWLRLNIPDTRIILMTGIAAGFGAVFGTPVTGAIFALEVLAIGSIRYDALLPCLIASILADIACTAWGIQHTHYNISMADKTQLFSFLHIDLLLLVKSIAAGIAFGLASWLFANLQHNIKSYSHRFIKPHWLVPAVGGLIIILFCFAIGTTDYLGLGVTAGTQNGVSIVSAFSAGGAYHFSWLWKLLFTAITLGMGFKGGEVTPLFFIGATLGNSIATLTGAPVDLFAALGFIAVFAGATNTPIACTIMGVELFGGEHVLYYAVACFTAYYFSGHGGIYTSQRTAVQKINNE